MNKRIGFLTSLPENDIRIKYNIKSDSRDWVLSKAILDLKENFSNNNFREIVYRPFDKRYTYYTGKPKGFFAYSQNRIMRNFQSKANWALISGRQGQAVGGMQWNLSFIANSISDQNIFYRGGGTVFPLYLYPESNPQQSIEKSPDKKPNLNEEIVEQIASKINHAFLWDENIVVDLAAGCDGLFGAVKILDYIYAILHHPGYREKYREFLKIDFPRIPYPKDAGTFFKLAKFGTVLRKTHLMETKELDRLITTFPVSGTNEVEKVFFDDGKVWINKGQYFDQVPETAWQFYIGGYQPA